MESGLLTIALKDRLSELAYVVIWGRVMYVSKGLTF